MNDPQGDRNAVINVNVGILGHVDSGKTSLVKALSTLLSTAALDKNPQSQARGITLDLGFSAFTLPMPEHLKGIAGKEKCFLQFTLVDCPGHASLIRTIIGGAQIIDMMILVIDANKGIQTQTAECIVIGEITTDKLIIVLNKCDLLPESEREAKIERMKGRLLKVFNKTKFANCPIIATSAALGGEKVASVGAKCALALASTVSGPKGLKKDGITMNLSNSHGVAELVDLIRESIEIPKRNVNGPLYYAIDHCFSIKGHGTILTGTILGGSVSVGSIIELPNLQVQRKVKSMQMFHKSVRTAQQGDRVGLCVTNLDPKLIERGIAVTPGSIPLLSTAICMVKKVRFFLEECKSNTKFHISIGHTTVAATVLFYGSQEIAAHRLEMIKKESLICQQQHVTDFESTGTYVNKPGDINVNNGILTKHNSVESKTSDVHTDVNKNIDIGPNSDSTINEKSKTKRTTTSNVNVGHSTLNSVYQKSFPDIEYPWDADFEYCDALKGTDDGINSKGEEIHWAVLQFQRPVFCPMGSLIIGSRLDTFATNAILEKQVKDGHKGEHASQCRLAFYGPLIETIAVEDMEKIKVYSWKEKIGMVDHITSFKNGLCSEFIGCNLVKEGGNIQNFIGMKIETDRGHLGVIMGPYGSGGNFKVKFDTPVPLSKGSKLTLRFKRYMHDRLKLMAQTGIDEYAQERASIIASLLPSMTDSNIDGQDSNDKKLSNRQKKAEKKLLLLEKLPVSEVEGSPPLSFEAKNVPTIDGKISNSHGSTDLHVSENIVTPSSLVLTSDSSIHDKNQPQNILNKDVEVILPKEKEIIDLCTAQIEVTSASTVSVPISPISKIISNPPLPATNSSSASPNSTFTPATPTPTSVSVSSESLRIGTIESLKPDSDPGSSELTVVAIVTGAFSREENIRKYKDSNVRVVGKNICGLLVGPFAKLGKCKIMFFDGIHIVVGDAVEIDISACI